VHQFDGIVIYPCMIDTSLINVQMDVSNWKYQWNGKWKGTVNAHSCN